MMVIAHLPWTREPSPGSPIVGSALRVFRSLGSKQQPGLGFLPDARRYGLATGLVIGLMGVCLREVPSMVALVMLRLVADVPELHAFVRGYPLWRVPVGLVSAVILTSALARETRQFDAYRHLTAGYVAVGGLGALLLLGGWRGAPYVFGVWAVTVLWLGLPSRKGPQCRDLPAQLERPVAGAVFGALSSRCSGLWTGGPTGRGI